MHANFKDLPDDARVWIYQANRPFTNDELNELKPQMDNFLQQWTAHGKDLLPTRLFSITWLKP